MQAVQRIWFDIRDKECAKLVLVEVELLRRRRAAKPSQVKLSALLRRLRLRVVSSQKRATRGQSQRHSPYEVNDDKAVI